MYIDKITLRKKETLEKKFQNMSSKDKNNIKKVAAKLLINEDLAKAFIDGGYSKYKNCVKKENERIIIDNICNDISYYVDYDYSSTECTGNCDDFCRCSKITNLHCTSGVDRESWIDSTSSYLAEINSSFRDHSSLYFLDRLYSIAKMFDKNLFNIETRGGYYGEEIGKTTFQNHHMIVSGIKFLSKNSGLKERIEYLLDLEYSFILENLNDRNYSIEKINLEDVEAGAIKHIKRAETEQYKTYKGIPSFLCIQEGTKYRLIDGYHRYCSLLSNSRKQKVDAIIAR